uniref:Uncharacterized protein n=1 Tax=Arundo donax TaxID=35708 RepID=A0A0A9SFK9_ARUDO
MKLNLKQIIVQTNMAYINIPNILLLYASKDVKMKQSKKEQ